MNYGYFKDFRNRPFYLQGLFEEIKRVKHLQEF